MSFTQNRVIHDLRYMSLTLLVAMPLAFPMGEAPESRPIHLDQRTEPDSVFGGVYDFAGGDTLLTSFVGYVLVEGFPNLPPTEVPVVGGRWGINVNPETSVPELPPGDEESGSSATSGSRNWLGFGCSRISPNSPKSWDGLALLAESIDRVQEGTLELICMNVEYFSHHPIEKTILGPTELSVFTRSATEETAYGEHGMATQDDYIDYSNNEDLWYVTLPWDFDGVVYRSQADTLHQGNSDRLTYFLYPGFHPDVAEVIENSPDGIRCVAPYWEGRDPVRVYTEGEAEVRVSATTNGFAVLDREIDWSSGVYGIGLWVHMQAPNLVASAQDQDGWKKEILERGLGNSGEYEGVPDPYKVGRYEFMSTMINGKRRHDVSARDLYLPE